MRFIIPKLSEDVYRVLLNFAKENFICWYYVEKVKSSIIWWGRVCFLGNKDESLFYYKITLGYYSLWIWRTKLEQTQRRIEKNEEGITTSKLHGSPID